MIECGPAEAAARAMVDAQRQLGRQPEPERLLDAVQMLVDHQ